MSDRICVYSPRESRVARLSALIGGELDAEILHARSDAELARRCREEDAMIVVVDEYEADDTIRVVRKCASLDHTLEIVVVGDGRWLDALSYYEVGASALVDDDPDALLTCIRAIGSGEAILDGDTQRGLLRRLQELHRLCGESGIDPSRCRKLTARERDVCRLLADHRTNAEIADRLGIEEGTVKSHVHHILEKLDVDSRERAGAYWRVYVNDRGESAD